METALTNEELESLMEIVSQRIHAGLFSDDQEVESETSQMETQPQNMKGKV